MRPLPFSGGTIYAGTFWGAYGLWVLSEIIASRLKRSGDSSRVRDRGSLVLIMVLWCTGMAINFSLAFLLPQTDISWRPSVVFSAGISLMLVGIAFRLYCIAILGKYFTFDVAIHSSHSLIETGPYRYIRHPSYTGALLTILGFGLVLGNWLGLIAFLFCMGLAYGYRIPVEEAALVAGLGEPYQRYVSRTWRLVPFLF